MACCSWTWAQLVQHPRGCFHKLGVPLVAVLVIRSLLLVGSILGPLIVGNSHVGTCRVGAFGRLLVVSTASCTGMDPVLAKMVVLLASSETLRGDAVGLLW